VIGILISDMEVIDRTKLFFIKIKCCTEYTSSFVPKLKMSEMVMNPNPLHS
jgi:hypothetical protein